MIIHINSILEFLEGEALYGNYRVIQPFHCGRGGRQGCPRCISPGALSLKLSPHSTQDEDEAGGGQTKSGLIYPGRRCSEEAW